MAPDNGPLVGILVGSDSDRDAIMGAVEELDQRGIANELNVLSAHRNPREVADYATTAEERGIKVLIAGAGMAAALPGVVAAHTELPVIGVPLPLFSYGGSSVLTMLIGVGLLMNVSMRRQSF